MLEMPPFTLQTMDGHGSNSWRLKKTMGISGISCADFIQLARYSPSGIQPWRLQWAHVGLDVLARWDSNFYFHSLRPTETYQILVAAIIFQTLGSLIWRLGFRFTDFAASRCSASCHADTSVTAPWRLAWAFCTFLWQRFLLPTLTALMIKVLILCSVRRPIIEVNDLK